MADNRLDVGLLINAGVEGLDRIDRVLDSMGDLGESTDQLNEEARRLREEWDNLSPEQQAERLRQLGAALNDTQDRNRDLNDEAERSEGVFSRMKGAILALGAALGVVFVVGKIKAFFSDAVTGAADFEQQLATVQAVSSASAEDMARLREAAEEMGASTRYSATEAAQGLENLARAGLDANESIAVLPSVLALAQGNGIGLAESASYITQAIAGMGMEMEQAGRVADVLSAAAANANTNVQDMGQALGYAAPTAASLGLTIEETAAYLGKFADAGIQGSRAGTSLNNMMAQFSNPASTFRRELAALNIRTTDFNQAIRELSAAGPKGQAAINALGMEAGPAFKALLGQGIGALDELTEKLENSSGFVAEQAATMDNTLQGAFAGLGSAWEAFKNKIATPILDPLKNKLKELAGVVTDLVNSGRVEVLGQAIADTFQKGADAVIRFVKEFDFGWLIDKVRGGFESLSTAGQVVNGVLQAFSITIQGVKAGFATLGIAISYVVQIASNAALSIIKVGAAVSDFFGITDNAVDKITDTLSSINDAAEGAREAFFDVINNAGDSIKDSWQSLAGEAKNAADTTSAELAKIPKASEEAAAAALQPTLTLYDRITSKVKEVTGAAEREAKKQADAAQEAARKTQEAQEQAAIAAKDAFSGIGVDLDEVFTGIGAKTRKAMSDYTFAVEQAMASGQDATKAARAGFEALAAQMASPQAWAAFKQHLQDSGQGFEHLTQNQIKRMEDAIKGLPDVAGTAMAAMKAKIESADVGSFARIRQEAETAFQAGELSAAQYAEVLRDLNDKTEQLRSKTQDTGETAAKAHDKAAEAAKKEAEAQAKAAQAKEKSAQASFQLYDATNLSAEAVEHLKNRATELNEALYGALTGSRSAAENVNRISREMTEYADNVRDAQAATEHLNQLTNDGSVGLQDIAQAALSAKTGMQSLDSTTLANLNQAIDSARQKLADMRQEAEDTRASLEAQLASLRGDDSKAAALEQEKKLREINLKLQEAERLGQQDNVKTYRQALELQKQIYAEQQKQARARKANEGSKSNTNNSKQNSGKSLSASDVADAWDERIKAAEKRGAQNFADELYKQAKRQPV